MTDEIFGIDYSSNGELTSSGDLMLVEGLDNAKQAIRNRLLTRLLIYDYLEGYGCDLDQIVGEPTNHSTLQLFNLILKDSLKQDPRVQEILGLDCYFEGKQVNAEMNLLLVDDTVIDLNLDTNVIGGLV